MGSAASSCQKTISGLVTSCQDRLSPREPPDDPREPPAAPGNKGDFGNGGICITEGPGKGDCYCDDLIDSGVSVDGNFVTRNEDLELIHSLMNSSKNLGESETDLSGSYTSYGEEFSICRKFSTRSKSIAFEKYILGNRTNSDLESPSENEDKTILCDDDDDCDENEERADGKIDSDCIDCEELISAETVQGLRANFLLTFDNSNCLTDNNLKLNCSEDEVKCSEDEIKEKVQVNSDSIVPFTKVYIFWRQKY